MTSCHLLRVRVRGRVGVGVGVGIGVGVRIRMGHPVSSPDSLLRLSSARTSLTRALARASISHLVRVG